MSKSNDEDELSQNVKYKEKNDKMMTNTEERELRDSLGQISDTRKGIEASIYPFFSSVFRSF